MCQIRKDMFGLLFFRKMQKSITGSDVALYNLDLLPIRSKNG